ncbi:MAG: enoyl-CoA hydratase-related protein [Pseudoxanthomonas sp.]|uniref:enoyl-CoA hydratase/isomerase family protein n=1 Tax=Hydrogenophaga sp. TaxID=1904254 RepID=UPI002717B5BC|nr:enoyl-CoA hydratase-related protein [Hydrogenophaga sp.]MDO9504266.1 enoyl-CoA hydratase-related protein [Hydrogenophaga sp.]MDZ4047390.1 enoyl-CoA hydratase-related protein [Pseudoxanthomonas sp.]MDZ4283904.1 enoyl-CoA hydratase-related protein [Hydrogenophaga sp.]
MNDFVLRERQGATLVIRINRPDRRNAFDLEVREGIAQAVYEARDDDSVRAVIITGVDGIFCAGGDLKSLSEAKRPVFKDRDRIRRLHTWFRELVNLEKPVIAAVDGPAFGAGFNLALACDFVLATPRARFCAVFGRIGLVPDLGGFFLLPRIVGLQRAKDLVFSAREVDAEEARSLGIVMKVVPAEQLLDEALAMAAGYHDASTEALGIAKNILNRSFNLDQDTLAELEASAQALALHTAYHDEAVANFLQKRPLRFPEGKK